MCPELPTFCLLVTMKESRKILWFLLLLFCFFGMHYYITAAGGVGDHTRKLEMLWQGEELFAMPAKVSSPRDKQYVHNC